MTRVRLIVTMDIDDDLDVQEVIDGIWSKANDIVDIELYEGDR